MHRCKKLFMNALAIKKYINFVRHLLNFLFDNPYLHMLLHKLLILGGFLFSFMCLEFCERLMWKSTSLSAQAGFVCMQDVFTYLHLHASDDFTVAFRFMKWIHVCIFMHDMESYPHLHALNGFIIAFAFMEWTHICICMHAMLSYLYLLACDAFTFACPSMRYFHSGICTHEMIS